MEGTLNNFLASSDPCVSDQHVPPLENVIEDDDTLDAEDLNYFDGEKYLRVSYLNRFKIQNSRSFHS